MKQHHSGKRISRRRFLRRDLWTGMLGLFTGTVFGLHDRPEAKAGPEHKALSPHEARFYSKLAG